MYTRERERVGEGYFGSVFLIISWSIIIDCSRRAQRPMSECGGGWDGQTSRNLWCIFTPVQLSNVMYHGCSSWFKLHCKSWFSSCRLSHGHYAFIISRSHFILSYRTCSLPLMGFGTRKCKSFAWKSKHSSPSQLVNLRDTILFFSSL